MIEGDPAVWAAKLDNSYESPYHQTTLKHLGTGNVGLPLTARIGQVYIALTEAVIEDYGLNPPASAQLTKADWIKPGRCAWQWLATGDPKESEQQQWIDWTSQLGFEYYLIDEGWEKWPDSWQAIASNVAYAKKKNVKMWISAHSRTVRNQSNARSTSGKRLSPELRASRLTFLRLRAVKSPIGISTLRRTQPTCT
jgi:alpha-glucosidase